MYPGGNLPSSSQVPRIPREKKGNKDLGTVGVMVSANHLEGSRITWKIGLWTCCGDYLDYIHWSGNIQLLWLAAFPGWDTRLSKLRKEAAHLFIALRLQITRWCGQWLQFLPPWLPYTIRQNKLIPPCLFLAESFTTENKLKLMLI